MTGSQRQLPEALHYVIWFNYQSANYEPLAVFNTKAEADFYIYDLKDWGKTNNQKTIALVQTMSWAQFCAFAQRQGTDIPVMELRFPNYWPDEQIQEFKTKIRFLCEEFRAKCAKFVVLES